MPEIYWRQVLFLASVCTVRKCSYSWLGLYETDIDSSSRVGRFPSISPAAACGAVCARGDGGSHAVHPPMGLWCGGRGRQHAWTFRGHRRDARVGSGDQWRPDVRDVFDHQSFLWHGQVVLRPERISAASGLGPVHPRNADRHSHRQRQFYHAPARMAELQLQWQFG